MKRIAFIFFIGFSCFVLIGSCIHSGPESPKNNTVTAASILEQISEPVIPDYTLNLADYGGLGNGKGDNKIAFEKAISALTAKGGGKLVVPGGTYIVNGPIHLTSNMNLHLEEGTKLVFGSDPADYLPVVKTSWEGTFLYNYSPFIYAFECTNVSITGKGILDGEASETWSTWKSLQKEDQLYSREMNHANTPLEVRIFGEGHFLRPHLIQFFDCKNVKVEGIKMEDSPFWCLHLLRCENVIVRGVRYDAQNKNNDGIDPEYSKNVLIEDVVFNNSDDNVAIKAGRDNEGRASRVCSENIVVRNCKFKGLHAIVIGSEMSAGVQNIFVQNCSYGGKLKRGIYLKSNPDRGGFIKNIFVKDVDFGEVRDCIYITSYYHNEGNGYVTEIKDVFMENINCRKATDHGIVIQGFPEKKVSNIYFKNVQIDTAGNPVSMTNTDNIVFSNLRIGKPATVPSFVK